MSVGELLDLEDGSELLAQARARWSRWATEDPRLAVVAEFDALRAWTRTVDREHVDQVLHGLAMLAATDGGDDLAAAAALAKCLLPGVSLAAGRVTQLIGQGDLPIPPIEGPLPQRVDGLFAAQLWIECRTFPWRRLTRVAANIAVNTRAGVLFELGDNTTVWRADRTWAITAADEGLTHGDVEGTVERVRDVTGRASRRPVLRVDELIHPSRYGVCDAEPTTMEELAGVLAWACEAKVISPADRGLLVALVQEANRLDTSRTGGCRGGLTGNELSIRVAPRVGMSQATVRRRAGRSMAALAAAAPERFPGHEW